MPVKFSNVSLVLHTGITLFRNALEYDAVACAAAEGHCNTLHYLLSLGQSPNGTHKVIYMYSIHSHVIVVAYVYLTYVYIIMSL